MSASTKMAINKRINGTLLKAFLGDENGNGGYHPVQGNQLAIPLVLNSTEGQKAQYRYGAEGRMFQQVLS